MVEVVTSWAVFVHPKMEVCGGQAGKWVQGSVDKIWVVMANEAAGVVASRGSMQGKVVR